MRFPDATQVTRLKITDNGSVGTSQYVFPNLRGLAGQVLMADGGDSVKWKFQKLKVLEDQDGDTKIEVEKIQTKIKSEFRWVVPKF